MTTGNGYPLTLHGFTGHRSFARSQDDNVGKRNVGGKMDARYLTAGMHEEGKMDSRLLTSRMILGRKMDSR
jgi:hypothetical protein